ncbi:uncharacterized protein LOC131639604 [Vicia villosa]|uniref:uncharacterized protein LOC131639604 n=1 Tax=Vicia villosa TaxID=3911 RepID=UPI00273C04CB|nr:uncharacterized protein LOC131639604 [Vicia villosa]
MSKQRFQQKDDEILIQSRPNVSKDSIVVVDKKGDNFLKKIGEAFNKYRDINYKERKLTTLKDEGEMFTFEAAWRLLKEEPKWLAGLSEAYAKRTKNSTSGAYFSSSNPLIPTSSEYNLPSPTLSCRPIGQKKAKMKEKEKLVKLSSTPNVKYDFLKDYFNNSFDVNVCTRLCTY